MDIDHVRIVFGDPPYFKDRDYYIDSDVALQHFFDDLWDLIITEKRFGVFLCDDEDMSDKLDS